CHCEQRADEHDERGRPRTPGIVLQIGFPRIAVSHLLYKAMGGARLSGVHNCCQFRDRALAPEVVFLSPQRLKPSHFRILTAPLKRCSTLYPKEETPARLPREQALACVQICREKSATSGEGRVSGHCRPRAARHRAIPKQPNLCSTG